MNCLTLLFSPVASALSRFNHTRTFLTVVLIVYVKAEDRLVQQDQHKLAFEFYEKLN